MTLDAKLAVERVHAAMRGEDTLPGKLPFPCADVPTPVTLGAEVPKTQREPELIGNVIRRMMGELQDLQDSAESRGEWFECANAAWRQLRAALVAISKEQEEV